MTNGSNEKLTDRDLFEGALSYDLFPEIDLDDGNHKLLFDAFRSGSFIFSGVVENKNITCVVSDIGINDAIFENAECLSDLIWKSDSVYVKLDGNIILKIGSYEDKF